MRAHGVSQIHTWVVKIELEQIDRYLKEMYIYNSAVIYTPIRFNLLLASYINLFKKKFVLWNMFLDLQTFFLQI